MNEDEEFKDLERRLAVHAATMAGGKFVKTAQPQQEPVAWFNPENFVRTSSRKTEIEYAPLYTAPPKQEPKREWVGLTDEEVFGLFSKMTAQTGASWLGLYRNCEAKLREKNA